MHCFELLKGFRKGAKGLGSEIVAMEWCPTMDLLALVMEDRQLVVYRAEGWQRLWQSSFDQPVTCLTWRPDGQVVAAGHADGTTTLFNVEDGEPTFESHHHTESLRLFRWLPAEHRVSSDSPYASDMASLFAPLPLLPKQPSAQALQLEEGTQPLDLPLYKLLFGGQAPLAFDVAVTVDARACIHLAVHGKFSLGKLPLAEFPALQFGGTPSPLCVQLTSSLQVLTVVTWTERETRVLLPDGTEVEHEEGMLLLAFRTGQLARGRMEIEALATLYMQCEALADRATTAIEAAKSVWSEAISPFHDKMESMRQMLVKEGRPASPARELLLLLACGVAPACVQHWIISELQHDSLGRTLKATNLAADALVQLCITTIHPALEMLVQRLSHVHGLSKWPYHFAALGLQERPPRVAAALEAAASLRASAEALLVAVRSSQVEFGMLFCWLIRQCRRLRDEPPSTTEQMPPVDAAIVAQFLSSSSDDGTLTDKVTALFSDAPTPLGHDVLGGVDALDALAPLPPTQRLPIAHAALAASLRDCFSPVAEHVSAGYQLHSCAPLAAGPPPAVSPRLRVSIEHPADGSLRLVLSICEREARPAAGVQLVLLRARWALDGECPPWEVCVLGGAPDARMVNALPYKQEQLLLLHTSDAGGTSSTLTVTSYAERAFTEISPSSRTSLLETLRQMLSSGQLAVQPLLDDECRSRTFAEVEAQDVSLSRAGFCSVVFPMRRILLLDLEEDEGEEGEEGEEGNEDMEGVTPTKSAAEADQGEETDSEEVEMAMEDDP
ncbi:hypothetical protein AB1Y20_005916 [Prymnesium parvum]|uniref:Anaphase-promoting complex subunit 4 n=1 Tax=Prymnesium parvum TaxID=97485 RepID=A0AB34J2Z6_PRYPA